MYWASVTFLSLIAVHAVSGGQYKIYTCGVASAASSLSASASLCRLSSGRRRDLPYGIDHTFIQIGSTCYDWGMWNYPRHVSCYGDEMTCCMRGKELEETRYSSCTNRVGEFERAWQDRHINIYNPLTWNCQVYTNAMKKFFDNCYSNPQNAIPVTVSEKFVRWVSNLFGKK